MVKPPKDWKKFERIKKGRKYTVAYNSDEWRLVSKGAVINLRKGAV